MSIDVSGTDTNATSATTERIGESAPQRWMLRGIGAYQRAFHGRPSPCRFFPSCSEYGAEAIRQHGAGRGLWLTVRRLVRCRPFGPSGFDPVPPPHHHLEH